MTTNKPKHKLTAQQLNTLDLIWTSMAISGFPMKLETLLAIGERFYGSDEPEEIRQAAEGAQREGLSMLEAVERHYGPPRPPKSPYDEL